MGTFKYYKAQPLPGPASWAKMTIFLGALFGASHYWDICENRQVIGSMHDRTYLYKDYYKRVEDQNKTYKPTFKRVE